jgi:hypothetical protein
MTIVSGSEQSTTLSPLDFWKIKNLTKQKVKEKL